MTKQADRVMDFDGLASKIGMSGHQMDEMRELFRQTLAQQRDEILDQVGEDVIGDDDSNYVHNYGHVSDERMENRNELRAEQRQKLSSLRLSIKKKV